MAKQVINVGTAADDRTGDTWRSAMQKSNSNFTELFDFDASLGFVFIAQESDFPIQDATTITLAADTVHIITASFSTAKKFTCNDGAVLTMDNQFGPVLTYSGTGNMFTGTDAFFTIRDIGISCPSAQVFGFTDTVPGTTVFLAINITIFFCSKVGTFTSINALDLSGSNSLGSGDGITMAGTGTLLMSIRQFAIASTSASFKAIDLGSTVISNIEASNLIVIAPAGAFGISGLANSGNVPTGSLAMVRDSSFIGGVTDLENITTDDIRWSFRDNAPTEDTQPDAMIYQDGNATATIIAATSTDGTNSVLLAGTWTEQRASLFTTTAAGRITYVGERDLTTPIDIVASVDPVSDSTLAIYITINGVPAQPTGIPRFVKAADNGVMSTIWQDKLSTNDFIEIFIENQTSTANILVSDVVFRVR